jgi:hypothetical protein
MKASMLEVNFDNFGKFIPFIFIFYFFLFFFLQNITKMKKEKGNVRTIFAARRDLKREREREKYKETANFAT